jgi:hypothetical protein
MPQRERGATDGRHPPQPIPAGHQSEVAFVHPRSDQMTDKAGSHAFGARFGRQSADAVRARIGAAPVITSPGAAEARAPVPRPRLITRRAGQAFDGSSPQGNRRRCRRQPGDPFRSPATNL